MNHAGIMEEGRWGEGGRRRRRRRGGSEEAREGMYIRMNQGIVFMGKVAAGTVFMGKVSTVGAGSAAAGPPPPPLLPSSSSSSSSPPPPPPPPPTSLPISPLYLPPTSPMIHGAAPWEMFHFVTAQSALSLPQPGPLHAAGPEGAKCLQILEPVKGIDGLPLKFARCEFPDVLAAQFNATRRGRQVGVPRILARRRANIISARLDRVDVL